MTKAVLVKVNIREAMARELREWAESQEMTFTQALHEAIALKLFWEKERAEGGSLVIEHRDGSNWHVQFKNDRAVLVAESVVRRLEEADREIAGFDLAAELGHLEQRAREAGVTDESIAKALEDDHDS